LRLLGFTLQEVRDLRIYRSRLLAGELDFVVWVYLAKDRQLEAMTPQKSIEVPAASAMPPDGSGTVTRRPSAE
jgi:hypothetical protein